MEQHKVTNSRRKQLERHASKLELTSHAENWKPMLQSVRTDGGRASKQLRTQDE